MANSKQQEKRNRQNEKRRLANLRYRSSIKTLFHRVDEAVEAGDGEALAARSRELEQMLDRASARGVLHRNTAARKKRQLSRIVAGSSSGD